MRCLKLAMCLALGQLPAWSAAKPSIVPVSHSLDLEVQRACPNVLAYSDQARQQRALEWQPGKVSFEIMLTPSERIGDLQTQRLLKACTLEAGRAIGGTRLMEGGVEAEQAVLAGVGQCLSRSGQASGLRVTRVVIRRGSVNCR